MKIDSKIAITFAISVFTAAHSAFAGDAKTFKEEVIIEEPMQWYNAELTTGWDSVYMFRGSNVLAAGGFGDTDDYGSGIYWTDLSFTWNITENDFLSVGSWMAFGTQNTAYKEVNTYTNYTHTIGDLSLSAGYVFYYVFGGSDFPYSHEVSAEVAYTFDFGFMSVVPSIGYFFNVGPDLGEGSGYAKAASSYLLLRVDASIPVYKDTISLDPWISYGTNFQYNARLTEEGTFDYFNGANSLEVGLGLPIQVNDVISVYGYVAYSYAFDNLNGTTNPSTVWGGGSVTFSF